MGKGGSEPHAGRALSPHPLTAHGAPSISQCCPPAQRTCCAPPSPASSLGLWGRQRGKQPETERGFLSRRETRDTWELAEEACEAGRTPGQPGTDWGLPGGQGGGEPGAGLGHVGRIQGRGGRHGQLLSGLYWAPAPAWTSTGAPWSWRPWGVAPSPCHLLGLGTVGRVWGREPGHLAALTPAPRVTEGIWFISSVRDGGRSLQH